MPHPRKATTEQYPLDNRCASDLQKYSLPNSACSECPDPPDINFRNIAVATHTIGECRSRISTAVRRLALTELGGT
jgi:hypothetical protein